MDNSSEDRSAEQKWLKWNGVDIPLTTHLGSGLTAGVYKVEINDRSYAAKILKPGSSAAIRKYFLSEITNLKLIWNAWFALYPDQPPVTPELLGADIEGESPFIIMELIDGIPLEKEIETKGPYPEHYALHLMSQFGRLLVCLHSSLSKVYSDIKFDNFWRLNGLSPDGYPQLKVTDWNVINDLTEEGRIRDLFFSTLTFFRLLTGSTLPYSRGQITAKLEDSDKYKDLSFGTKDFFYKALNINVDRRFHTAESWLEEIDALNNNWQKKPNELNLLAAQFLDEALQQQSSREITKATENFRKARIVLDVSGLKGRGNADVFMELSTKVDKGFESTSHREKGLISLKGGQYQEAKAIFDEGADLSVLEPTLLRRLYWLSCAADEIGFDGFNRYVNDAIDAVKFLVRGDSLQAQHSLDELKGKLARTSIPSLEHLISEAKILNLYNDATRMRDAGKYDDVVTSLLTAYDLYKDLPTTPRTNWAEKIGDIKPLLQEAVNERDTLGISDREVTNGVDFFSNGEIENAGSSFLKAITAAPENPKVINQLRTCVNKSLEAGRWSDAGELLEQAVGFANIKEIFKDQLELINQLNYIALLIRQGRSRESLDEIIQYSKNNTGNPIALGNSYKNILLMGLENSLASDDLESAEKIVQLATSSDPTWGKEFSEKLDKYQEQLHQRIEDTIPHLLLKIYDLHDQKTVESSQQATEFLTRLKAIVPPQDARLTSIEQVEKLVTDRLNSLISIQDQKRELTDKKSGELRNACEVIKQRVLDKESKLNALSVGDPVENHAHSILVDEIARLSAEGLKATHDWRTLNPTDRSLDGLMDFFKQKIEQIGYHGWKELNDQSKAKMVFIDQQRNELDLALNRGDLVAAGALLETVAPPYNNLIELVNKRSILDGAKKLMSWAGGKSDPGIQDDFPTELPGTDSRLERDIEIVGDLTRLDIPPTYWRSAKVDSYFSSASRQTIEELRRAHGGMDPFLLSRALKANQLARKAQIKIDPKKKDEKSGTTKSLHHIFKKFNEYGSAKGTTKAKKLSQLLTEINTLQVELPITPGIVEQEFHKFTLAQAAKNKQKKKLAKIGLFTLLGIVVAGIVIAGIIFIPKWIKARTTVTPPAETEAPVIIIVTQAPTVTPTIELTPTPPLSAFLIKEALPGIKDKTYVEKFLIDTPLINFNDGQPVGQIEATDSGINGNMVYFDSAKKEDVVNVEWSMDMGLQTSGLYEILIMDTKNHSYLGDKDMEVSVLADGILVPPLIGPGSLKYEGFDEEKEDQWTSLGIYQLEEGSTIKIKTSLTDLDLAPGTFEFGIDATFLARIDQPKVSEHGFLKTLSEDAIPVAFADYTKAEFSPGIETWLPIDSQPGLNTGGYKIELANLGSAPRLTLPFTIELPGPGRYRISTLVSDQLSTNLSFEVFLDGTNVGSSTLDSKVGFSGTLQTILEFDVPEGKHKVEVGISPENFDPNQNMIMALDAVTLSIIRNGQ